MSEYIREQIEKGLLPVCFTHKHRGAAYYPAAYQCDERITKWVEAKSETQVEILEEFRNFYGRKEHERTGA